jgi:hypothetical protein
MAAHIITQKNVMQIRKVFKHFLKHQKKISVEIHVVNQK